MYIFATVSSLIGSCERVCECVCVWEDRPTIHYYCKFNGSTNSYYMYKIV